MRRSLSLSLILAFSAPFITTNDSQAQTVPPAIRQVINDLLAVNPIIARELQTPLRRCKNQIARKKTIDDYGKSLAPNIAKLISDKAAAEATLVLAARDLTTAQSAASAAAAALATIDQQLNNRSLSGEQQIAAIERQIAQAVAEKEVAADLLDDENDAWDRWKNTGTNDDDLDAAANRQFNNQTLTARDREVLAALSRHQTAVDTLNGRVLLAENHIAAFLRSRQDAQNGIQQEVSALRRQKNEKVAEKRTADERVATIVQARNLKESEVRSLSARISSLTAVKAPPIHWACSKLVAG